MGRPQFEQVVASAPREKIQQVDLTGSITVNAGALNTVQFFAPSGYIGEVLGLYTTVQGVPASTTGTHQISFGFPQFKISKGVGVYNTPVTWNNSWWSQANSSIEPSSNQTMVNVLRGLKFDDVIPFELIYTNNTDKTYSASRGLILVYVIRQIAK